MKMDELERTSKRISAECHKLVETLEKKQKEIAELEKENAELRQINRKTLARLNIYNGELIIENEKLKKENAELKEKVGKYQIGMFDEIEKRNKRLTKAEELIEKLLNAFASNDFFEEEELSAMAEAEKFLNEVE